MNRAHWLRYLPLGVALALLALAFLLWPHGDGRFEAIAWINFAIILTVAVTIGVYGVRMLRQQGEPRAGSILRAKLVIALVGTLLIPTGVILLSANRMVERGMDVWFDVRVDTLLERALGLAQSFYSRVEGELKKGASLYQSDPIIIAAVSGNVGTSLLTNHLLEVLQHEGWQRIQLFDFNERLIADVRDGRIGLPMAEPLGESAHLATNLGQVVTELGLAEGKELAVAYVPLPGTHGVAGLARIEVELPSGVVQRARAIEQDYRDYRDLERNRQAIANLFTHLMLIITLAVLLLAGLAALYFVRRLTAPITDLADALRRVTEGDLDVSISVASSDELGSLVRSFNRMTQHLKQNVEALQQAQFDLTNALASSRQRQEILETLLANLQTGVLLLHADGRIRLLNASLQGLLSLPEGWIPGQTLRRIATGRLQPIADFADELLHRQQGMLQREIDIPATPRTLHLLVRGAILSESGESGISGLLLMIDDVSSLAEAQRNRAWAEVAQRLAHEIKNPLTPIKLATERMQRRFRKEVGDLEVFDACTGAVIAQVERLQRLIGEFSTLARLPRPRKQRVDLAQLLAEMRDLYAAYPHLEVEIPAQEVPCDCDPDQFRQVTINLIDNALAATAAQPGRVLLHASAANGYVELHLLDYGSGIDEAHRAHLFEPYFSTKTDGSGLGLAIARRIAEEHDGQLELLAAGQPTHFRFRLPQVDPELSERSNTGTIRRPSPLV